MSGRPTALEAGASRCFDAAGRLIDIDALLTGARHLTFGYDAASRLTTPPTWTSS